jgi:hypothetical protein
VPELRRENFDRDTPPQPRIARSPHVAHPAFADGGDDFVRAEVISRGEWHVIDSAWLIR